MVFTNEILFLVLKFVLNKINLSRDSAKLDFTLFFVALLSGQDFCFIVTLTLYLVSQHHQRKACSRNIWEKSSV